MDEKIKVMMAGIPGKMSSVAARHIHEQPDMWVTRTALTGEDIKETSHKVAEGLELLLVKPSKRSDLLIEWEMSPQVKPDIVVDYIHSDNPTDIMRNVDFYCNTGLSFVMGSTDMKAAMLDEVRAKVAAAGINAVISANMATQIVAFQQTVSDFADKYAGRWQKDGKSGLYIRESHQGIDIKSNFMGKPDTSGTVRELLKFFNKIGIDIAESDINMIRDMDDQSKLGVMREYLKGHAWHMYKMSAKRESANREILDEFGRHMKHFVLDNPVFDSFGSVGVFRTQFADDTYGKVLFPGEPMPTNSYTLLFQVEFRDGEVRIDHNVNGREIYGVGTPKPVRDLYHLKTRGNLFTGSQMLSINKN